MHVVLLHGDGACRENKCIKTHTDVKELQVVPWRRHSSR